jgi:hypothetical protein
MKTSRILLWVSVVHATGCLAQLDATTAGCEASILYPVVMLHEPAERKSIERAVDEAFEDSGYSKRAESARYESSAHECYVMPQWRTEQRLVLRLYVRSMTLDEIRALSDVIEKNLRSRLAEARVRGAIVTDELLLQD